MTFLEQVVKAHCENKELLLLKQRRIQRSNRQNLKEYLLIKKYIKDGL